MKSFSAGRKKTTFQVSDSATDYFFAAAGSSPLADQGMDATIAAAIAATGAGATYTLPAGIVTVNNAISLPATFQGKRIKAHASGTTIVRGVVVPSQHIRGLSTNDPWYYRFPAASRDLIKCVDLSALSIDAGGWPDTSGKHTSESFDQSSSYNRPISVQVGTQAMEFAQERGSTTMGTNAWRVCSGVNGAATTTKPRFSGATVPANAADLRVVMTDDNDYAPKNWAVSATDPQNAEITVGAASTTFANNKQRAKLINAPEFLSYEGAMVLSITRGKLYYIPPSGQSTLMLSNHDEYVLTMTDPINMEDSTTYNGSYARRMTVEGIRFAACGGSHIHNQTANWAVYKDCIFDGSAAHSVRLSNVEGVLFDGCEWHRGRKNPVIVTEQRATRAASPATAVYDTGPFGARDSGQVIIPGVFMRSNITAPTFLDCRVEDMSLLYPGASSMSLGTNYAILGGAKSTPWLGGGETVTPDMSGCVFKNLSGAAVQNNIMRYSISGNLFQDCAMDITDGGAVAAGRSSMSGDTTINNNGFKNCTKRHTTTMSDDVSGVFLDDGVWGYTVYRNYFDTCTLGVLSNGGRQHYFYRNAFDDCTDCIRAANMLVATADVIANQILTLGAAMDASGYSSGAVDIEDTWTPGMTNTTFADDWYNVYVSFSFTGRAWSVTSSTQPQKDEVTDFASITDTVNASANINLYMKNAVQYHVTAGDKIGTTGSTLRWQSATAPQQNGYDVYDSGDAGGAESTPAFE